MPTYGDAALAALLPEQGQKESPAGSNYGPRVYMDGRPWCATFVTWGLVQMGFDPRALFNTAYCPSWLVAGRTGTMGMRVLRPGEKPEKGDVVLYDWETDGVADHIGIVSGVGSTPGVFYAIEGNTSFGDNSNGGQVMNRQRNIGDVIAFIRLPQLPKLTLAERLENAKYSPAATQKILSNLIHGRSGTKPNPNDSVMFRNLRAQGIGAANARLIIKSMRKP